MHGNVTENNVEHTNINTKCVNRRICWLKHTLIQKFVDTFTDLPEVESVLLGGAVKHGEELHVGKVVEDMINATVGAGGEVVLHQLMEQVLALQ